MNQQNLIRENHGNLRVPHLPGLEDPSHSSSSRIPMPRHWQQAQQILIRSSPNGGKSTFSVG